MMADATQSGLVESLVRWFEPWQTFYSHSKGTESAVTFVHLVGLLFGGGFAVATDRLMLRATARGVRPADDATAVLDSVRTIHRPVLIGLTLLALSGLALATADVETFATSVTFWVKMGLVALLGINGLVLMKTETQLRTQLSDPYSDASKTDTTTDVLWRRLRVTAIASMTLWTATMLAGVVLVNS